jgi:peptidylprolyl isomerase
MIRIFITVSVLTLFLSSCSDSSVNNSEELVAITEEGAYKMQIDLDTDLLVEEISKQYDIVNLSYAHGIATSEQLKREQLEFIDLKVFIDHLDNYFQNPSSVPGKEEMSIKVQEVAKQNNGNLKNLIGTDKEVVEESVAALFFDLFVDHIAFNSLDVDSYKKGLKEAWEGSEIEGAQELLQSYFKYKGSFTKELGLQFLAKNKLRGQVMETASGLQYEVISESNEVEGKPRADSEVTVHYHGELLNGKVFDSSYNRGETISFGLGQVIPGWTEGLQLMSLGSKYRFYIPYELAYGEKGNPSIPGFSMLIFDVELFEFN